MEDLWTGWRGDERRPKLLLKLGVAVSSWLSFIGGSGRTNPSSMPERLACEPVPSQERVSGNGGRTEWLC